VAGAFLVGPDVFTPIACVRAVSLTHGELETARHKFEQLLGRVESQLYGGIDFLNPAI